ncbi:MAG TPA: NAD(P)/FAD-dependent oxidoreductase [Candidatus Baltobacteraceae bacterium]|nr:NAD(P)/FAD-dependent oxidoreductase [Candidatus Baltobacteraceae bacterium]
MDAHARIIRSDAVVVGAGAAGLAAARTLAQCGIRALVVESRHRIGGRAYTVRTPDGAFPIELGAEFVHGDSAATTALLRESDTRTIEVDSVPGVWEVTQAVLDRVDVDGSDSSVDGFLKSVDMEGVDQARMLIEGFDAALTADASVIAIAREWRSDANNAQSRPLEGYGKLVKHLAAGTSDKLLLDTRVERIAWSPGRVEVCATRYGEPLEIHASRAIITVPVGVLQEQLQFKPPLPPEKHAALHAIAMGPVVKVALHFRSAFWNGGFFQTPPGCGFPTLWSRMPQKAPILMAWAGGDAVRRLDEKHPDPIRAALDACEAVFPQVDVRAQLQAAYVHDWQGDPYARGAYSYLRVNGGDAREVLRAPVAGTLYFAGEATSSNYAGTVSGAIETGEQAALAVAESLTNHIRIS